MKTSSTGFFLLKRRFTDRSQPAVEPTAPHEERERARSSCCVVYSPRWHRSAVEFVGQQESSDTQSSVVAEEDKITVRWKKKQIKSGTRELPAAVAVSGGRDVQRSVAKTRNGKT